MIFLYNMTESNTFWLSNSANIVRFLHHSFTSWKHVMMADINLLNGDIRVFHEESDEDKAIIAAFSVDAGTDVSKGFRRLQLSGNDGAIVKKASDIVMVNGDVKLNVLKVHIHAALACDYSYNDATKYNPTEIKELMDCCFEMYFSNGAKNSCYCGITNDLDIRMQQHREEDFEIEGNRVFAWVCATCAVAKEVEKLAENDYDIGKKSGTGGKNDSIIVYLLKKGKITL